MNNDDDETWNQLVNAAKQVGAGKTGIEERSAPQRFVAHMRKVRGTLWDLAKALLWRRWSLIAIVVACVLYLIAYLLLKQDPAPVIPTPQPPNPLSP
jgi:hypothetical protein